jgi:hypothetical protein
MNQKWLNPTETTQAGARIATLRGLYGDLAQYLDDLETRVDIWTQISDEQDQLELLMCGRQMYRV